MIYDTPCEFIILAMKIIYRQDIGFSARILWAFLKKIMKSFCGAPLGGLVSIHFLMLGMAPTLATR